MPKQKLFNDDSGSDVELKTDTDYAKNYNTWRKKEELHKLQARHGDIGSTSSSESSSDDDEEEPEPNFNRDFFKTLSYLKTKDNRIYDKNFEFFETSNTLVPNKKKKKEQPMYLKDYERKMVLENGGELSDDEEKQRTITYTDEQNELKQNLKNALCSVENEEDDTNWGGLFHTRDKTNQEKEKEEDEYSQWLAGQSETLKEAEHENELKPLKQYWNDPKLEEGEKFLRDYILKKQFLDEDDADYVPTYDEIVHDSDKDFSEDEKAIDKQEEFEHKYNFRFEEPDQDFIKRYPRTMENSLRQKDDKRKAKRLERRERKTEEKKQKMQEISKMKELKRQEIQEKICKLKEVTGNTEIAFDIKDFEEDFDPDEYDRRMQNLFNEEFYEGAEGEQKPEFPDLDEELELENWDYWHGDNDEANQQNNYNTTEEQPHCEDQNFNMDCEYDPATTQQELISNSKRRKKRKRKTQFAKILSEPKPVFDPNNRTYQEYLDEYYKLDCEDIIDDIPCRFKYRRVVPNNFGLSVEEILGAKDKELNRWCSLKKALQHRPEHIEKYDVIAFSKKAANIDLKKKYLPSLFEAAANETDEPPSTSKTCTKPSKSEVEQAAVVSISDIKTHTNKKKRKRPTNNNELGNNPAATQHASNTQTSMNLQKKRKQINKIKSTLDASDAKRPTIDSIVTPQASNEDNRSTGVNNNKHKRLKNTIDLTPDTSSSAVQLKGKKRFKHQDSETQSASGRIVKHKKQFKKNNKSKLKPEPEIGISDARLAAYGFKPKKFKNKLKYGGV